MSKNGIVKRFMEEGITLSPEIVDSISERDFYKVKEFEEEIDHLDKETLSRIRSKDKCEEKEFETSITVEKCFEGAEKEKDVDEFVQYFNDRFFRLKDFLINRVELSDAVSIGRLSSYSEKEDVSIIGMVENKYKVSSGRWIVNVEDDTGSTKVLVDEDEGEWIVSDEVLGFKGVTGDDIVFSSEVVRPDVPLSRDYGETDDEVYAAFLSDLHFGSKDTLENKAMKFAEWICSGSGIAEKIGYVFLNGDIAEGIGNYPGQEDDLVVEDVYSQYDQFQEFVEILPEHIQIIVTPGNHDVVRMAEPQPPLPEKICENLHDKQNVHFLSNPATVKIHDSKEGEGLRVLLYHGYSFDGHVDSIPDLRENAYEDPCRCMVDYIKRRHLAPTYGTSLLSPEDRDYLVIDKVPDIFVMGHTHGFNVSNYKGINLISSGTLQSQTSFQKRMGHKPDPGKIALVNLSSRDVKVKEV